MKVLVLNGSPRKEQSDTLKISKAFVEGLGDVQCEIVNIYDLTINPCMGCFGCWRGEGVCMHNDDANALLAKLYDIDILIFSTPLYCYSVPSQLKAFLDRTLSLSSRAMYVDSEGKTHHKGKRTIHFKTVVISGSGFPDMNNNFEALDFQFRRMFGDIISIYCVECPLFSVSVAQMLTQPYLDKAKEAGREVATEGKISGQTQEYLATPMLDPDEYRRNVNG